jgi:hypothetical protein
MLAEIDRPRPLRSPFPGDPALSEREMAHRRLMLAHFDTLRTGSSGRPSQASYSVR